MPDQKIFVLIEQQAGELLNASLETLGEALDLAETVGGEAAPDVSAILLMGDADSALSQNLAKQLARYGASKILTIHHPALAHFNASAWVTALHSALSSQSSVLLLSATPNGRELAPRLAVLLNAGLIADSVRVRFERGKAGQTEIAVTVPLYNDRVYSEQRLNTGSAVISFRPGARGLDRPGERGLITPQLSEIRLEPETLPAAIEYLGFVPADPSTVSLPEAEKIVCGGAGVGKEHFNLMWELADQLGAAVGGTRVAVDKGWLEWDRQIGQTGQVVAPRLFVSCGTSGAGQHVTGMKDSRTIVVINNDRNAPMFSLADFGAVGDVHEIVPRLLEKLRQRRQANAVTTVSKEEATV
jgi:electron transfer flavoprotein alpha subunit